MHYARLGASGLHTSRIVLGAMMFGGRTDEAESARIVAAALDDGVTHFDTADVYNSGRSEEILGRALKTRRDEAVVATKLGNPMGEGPLRKGLSRRWIMDEARASLRRLGMDHVDILYLHREDHDTPLDETVRALEDLIRAGDIRYFGVSNHRAWRVALLSRLADDAGINRPVVCQLYYHALNRTAEADLLPACGHLGLGAVAYSPIARGVLTGKYADASAPPEGSRAASADKRIAETEFHPANLAAAARLKAHADRRGLALEAFAVAWALRNPLLTGIIAGPRTLDQWKSYLPALDVEIGPEDEAAVGGVTPAGLSAIPLYTDPAYPIEGRPTGA